MVLKKLNYSMTTTLLIFYIFAALAIIASIFVVTTKNPVFSILFLVFNFFNISSILFLFKFELLPITFIIVYVGAIAVLFLFVIMMLNIKLSEITDYYTNFMPLSFIFCLIIVFEIVILFRFEFITINTSSAQANFLLADYLNNNCEKLNFITNFFNTTNIQTVAYALFNNYLYIFLLSSIILLLAMVSAIVLTINKKFSNKQQNFYFQILRQIV